MLKFTRKNKKLVIPVGINPSYNIDSSTLYNTTDADVVANDVIAGKVAYGADGKIVGTLDIESEKATSFENGYATGQEYGYESGYGVGREEGFDAGIEEQKSKLETITITENGTYNREDGYNEVIVEVPDLNGDYNEGYSDGVIAGREEIITEQSDATITPQTVFKGEIGYGANNEKIVGEFEYVDGFDFGKIGYSQELSNEVNSVTAEKLAYSKQLYDEWDPNRISAQGYFQFKKLVYAPNVDCSNIVNASSMFSNCSTLTTVPALNTSNCQYFNYMFNYCTNLTTVGLIDTSSAKEMYYMFYYCSGLTSVPLFNTSNVTNMNNMFYYCSNLTSIPEFDTSNVTIMKNMFYNCTNLTSVPQFVTSNVSDMYGMFQGCSNLTSIPQFNTSNVTTMRNMFYQCTYLTSIPEMYAGKVSEIAYFCEYYSNTMKLTNFGGLVDLGKGFSNEEAENERVLNLSTCANLTYESCMNIINKVYDMNLTDITDAKIKLHATPYALLSADDIAIATNKGWTIQ